MKKLLLLSIGILLCASIAYGQAGYIGLFSDPVYTACDVIDAAAALVPVYVVHKSCPGATASQFMVQPGGGWNCTFTGEIIAVPVSIGSSLAGLSASYGGCMPSDILISTLNWFCMGTSPACASLEVVPDLGAPSGTIEIVDCSFVKLVGNGSILYANPDGSCDCGEIVPTRESNWGQIKSLYGD
jgi:hypothetical protein